MANKRQEQVVALTQDALFESICKSLLQLKLVAADAEGRVRQDDVFLIMSKCGPYFQELALGYMECIRVFRAFIFNYGTNIVELKQYHTLIDVTDTDMINFETYVNSKHDADENNPIDTSNKYISCKIYYQYITAICTSLFCVGLHFRKRYKNAENYFRATPSYIINFKNNPSQVSIAENVHCLVMYNFLKNPSIYEIYPNTNEITHETVQYAIRFKDDDVIARLSDTLKETYSMIESYYRTTHVSRALSLMAPKYAHKPSELDGQLFTTMKLLLDIQTDIAKLSL